MHQLPLPLQPGPPDGGAPEKCWYGALTERAIDRIVDEHFAQGAQWTSTGAPGPARPAGPLAPPLRARYSPHPATPLGAPAAGAP